METAPQIEHAPPAFHILAKPAGATCNLDCTYCFFLSKEMLYPGSRFRMADELLEKYIQQLIESHRIPEVTIAWQGGEPTLMGLDFFKRSIEYQNKHKKPGMHILNTIQTNGVLLDDEWAAFFKENKFLVGISIDGPREMHDAYRVDKGGKPTFDRVMKGLDHLKDHGVEFNVLTTVHAANGDHPVEVYGFMRDELEAEFIQFIPIIERGTPETIPVANQGWGGTREDRPLYINDGSMVTVRSIAAEQYGNFLIGVFDEWVRNDVGRIYVQIFDVSLASWVGAPPALCIFSPTCGNALAMEHNGDVYSCDHFVEPDYLLGNIEETHMIELVASDKQQQFGRDKFGTLPQYCLDCDVRFACHGGCPKNRFIDTPDGEPGLNYLCAGYKAFFHHVDHPMKVMSDLLRRNRAPAEIMLILEREEEARLDEAFSKARRNEACPCGSGKKFKQCHGQS